MHQAVRSLSGRGWSQVVDGYGRLLERRPLATRAVTAGIILAAGDLLAQKINRRPCLDFKHAGGMGMYGACVIAPLAYRWFIFLNGRVGTAKISSRLGRALVMVGLDMAVPVPFFCYAFHFYSGAVMGDRAPTLEGRRGRSIEEEEAREGGVANGFRRANQLFLPTLSKAYMFWPVASFTNFYFVGLKYRVLWLNCMAFIWNTFLCTISTTTTTAYKEPTPKTYLNNNNA